LCSFNTNTVAITSGVIDAGFNKGSKYIVNFTVLKKLKVKYGVFTAGQHATASLGSRVQHFSFKGFYIKTSRILPRLKPSLHIVLLNT
jgi:hypothetical protein